ncbi:MAG: hypothetical protein JO102_03980, partial [Elusimicrobia bacterium]|nr:hypothetical protein [Elusimicrobiota bacterium]
MNVKRTIAIAASLISLSIPSMAAPSVSSVGGTISNGQSITITGSGFGVKSPAAPYLWADFSSSINPSTRGVKTSWDGVQSMTWTSNEGLNGGGAAKSSDSNGACTLEVDYNNWTNDNQHFYVYKRTKQNFLITSTTQNWKQFRMWSAGMTFPDVYFAPSNGECYVEDITGSGFYGSFNPSSTNWVTEEILGKASSSPGVKDGSLVFRVDGSQKTSGSLVTSNSTYPNRMSIMYPFHAVAANKGSWSPGWSSTNAVWVDNLYVDTTWARVMLGDASTYSSCQTLDVQIPTAWADGSVSVVMNVSSFSSGARAYLYVVDKDGNVNTNGYAVTIGQGSTQTNAAP